MTKPYVGDTGTIIQLDTGASLTGATSLSIEAKRPDGTVVSWAATAVDGTKVQFVTLANSLNMAGDWKLQARVTLPTGTWTGEVATLRVYRLFD